MRSINTTLKEIRTIIDKLCRDKQNEGYRYLLLSVSSIASRHSKGERAIRSNGFPSWFDQNYNACTWKRYKGLHIIIDQYLDERQEEEHTKQMQQIAESTTDLSTIL